MVDRYFWKVLLTPGCWLQNYPYSKEWDKILTDLMKYYSFKLDFDCHTAVLGDRTIWISNHPYASFTSYYGLRVRPSRRTIFKAREALLRDIFKTDESRSFTPSIFGEPPQTTATSYWTVTNPTPSGVEPERREK